VLTPFLADIDALGMRGRHGDDFWRNEVIVSKCIGLCEQSCCAHGQ
jgi:hypothetical protein